jgi:hypothetical protein
MRTLIVPSFFAWATVAMAQAASGTEGGFFPRSLEADPQDAKSNSTASGGSQATQISTSTSSSASPSPFSPDEMSLHLPTFILVALGGLVILFLAYRIIVSVAYYIRTLVCLNNKQQLFFRRPSPPFAKFKKHVLYAPLFRKRHVAEFRPFPWLNLGGLPSRIQSFVITGVLAMNIALMVKGLGWKAEESEVLNSLMARSGTLAVVNLIPMVILSGRNNPLIPLLGIEYGTFNVVHRWFGRLVSLESFIHGIAWGISKYRQSKSSSP